MSLLKHGRLAADPWLAVADDADLPPAGAVLVSLARWQNERAALRARNGAVGVRLPNSTPIETIAGDLDRVVARAQRIALLLPARQRHQHGAGRRQVGIVGHGEPGIGSQTAMLKQRHRPPP